MNISGHNYFEIQYFINDVIIVSNPQSQLLSSKRKISLSRRNALDSRYKSWGKDSNKKRNPCAWFMLTVTTCGGGLETVPVQSLNLNDEIRFAHNRWYTVT
ncbi:hypothetical protein RRG08_018779 [Elysia crispata]|uniref:Uncharacterized protein n=1 Tax=Elysia crispata TaxID=231223 RepID=A0AAE1AQI9_9GAST|nr:hypothetical protein RRG08_018779 [Elysia crispata]